MALTSSSSSCWSVPLSRTSSSSPEGALSSPPECRHWLRPRRRTARHRVAGETPWRAWRAASRCHCGHLWRTGGRLRRPSPLDRGFYKHAGVKQQATVRQPLTPVHTKQAFAVSLSLVDNYKTNLLVRPASRSGKHGLIRHALACFLTLQLVCPPMTEHSVSSASRVQWLTHSSSVGGQSHTIADLVQNAQTIKEKLQINDIT